MKKSLFFYNKFISSLMVAVVLLLGILALKSNAAPVVQAEVASESTVDEDTTGPDDNIVTFEHGTCTVTFDTNSGVLTIGPGTLDGAKSYLDPNMDYYGISLILNAVQSGTRELVKTVEIEPGVVAPRFCKLLFAGFPNLTEFKGLENLNVENVEGFNQMFMDLPSLKSIDLSSWKNTYTAEQVVATYMFSGDESLKTVVLGDIFHTDEGINRADARYIFEDCYNLSELIIPEGVSFYLSFDETDSVMILNKFYNSESNTIFYSAVNKRLDPDGEYVDNLEGPLTAATQGEDEVFVNEYLKYTIDGEERTEKIADHKVVKIYDDNGDPNVDVVNVPEIDGYTPTVKTVSFKIPEYSGEELNVVHDLPEKSETESEVVDYVKNPDPVPDPDPEPVDPVEPEKPSNNGGSSSNYNPIKDTSLLVATFPTEEFATLYSDQGTKLNNVSLAGGTDWRVDKTKEYGSNKYYRVATNEWVKASDAYVYEDQSLIVKTGDSTQNLTNSQGNMVSNRALSSKSSWRIDRLAYINGVTYYRVATNEFVPTEKVSLH